MGYRARWLAVKNAKLAAVLETVGLREESKSDEPIYDTGWYAVSMPGDYLVVMGDGWDYMDKIQPAHALVLSKATEAIHFYTDDSAMCATIACFVNGQEGWSLAYDGSNGPGKLTISGKPPAIVAEIVARVGKDQAEEDAKKEENRVDHAYDAAPEIGLALTGFRHDQTLGSGDVLPIRILAEKK